MKQLFMMVFVILIAITTYAQKKKYIGLTFFNTQTDIPFGKFAGLFKDALHPGLEFRFGKNISTKKNHDWFREWRLAYFYHRYVQSGIPLYFDMGYRRHFIRHFEAETSIGAGVMRSIPGTQVFNQNDVGEWHALKLKGRWQLIATYEIGIGYTLNPQASRPLQIFSVYQQRIQFPFVNSYIPLLPYNSFMIGVSKTIGNKSKNKLK